MRAATVLVGLLVLGGSAYAADAQVKVVVASADMKQMPAVRAQPAAAPVRAAAPKVDVGDSRFNNYRLEQESCCGMFLAP